MYQVIPSGLLINPAGLGLHYPRKRDAMKAVRELKRKHPRGGWQIVEKSQC